MIRYIFVASALLCTFCASAQVAIGTTTPSKSSIFEIESTSGTFVPPRMTDAEMRRISSPLPGSVVYNTTDNALFLETSAGWIDLTISPNASVVLNSSFIKTDPNGDNDLIQPGGNDAYHNFPLGASETLSIKSSVFEVTGLGTIRIKQAGNYLFTGGLAIIDLPNLGTKYILALYINDSLVGYLSRGFVSQGIVDYWGTTGSLIFPLEENDTVSFKYLINNGKTDKLDARFINIGVMKL
ncbi:MAG TPA: hypothetical protein ENH91_03075 [Leeuwenhoekiella sp.]|nr:hypothetical protein [Leeuwenhoekiella sp.]